MTHRELIEKRIPYPISDMVIKNCMPNHSRHWLDLENYRESAHELLLSAFTFSETPEGMEFWNKIYDKLKAKNL